MRRLERYSEPYQPTGGLAAEGVLNQLGRPDIDALEVLVREAVQNCWDAKRADEPSVTVEIGKQQLSEDAAEVLRTRVLVDPPRGLELAQHISGRPTLLYFADFGTSGLGGPTRGDRAIERTNSDFADFVFNIGQPPDKELGGGSFGYGKAAFFIASAAKTILIDTLCTVGRGTERRLMACGLGQGFVQDGVPYTGRHWWGVDIGGAPSPLVGPEAAEIASLLGLPERRSPEDRGTTIAIVAPDLNLDDDILTPVSMTFVAEALAWNFWPKMVGGAGGQPTMRFRVRDEGVEVPVPDPRRHPRLRPFVEALDLARADDDSDPGEDPDDPLVVVRRISSLRPRQHLGRLAIVRTVALPDPAPRDPDAPQPLGAMLTSAGLHHVALMRSAELVVRYLPGREPATGRFGYAGVFKCALPVDAVFRQAEPPTHDDWVARALPSGRERTFVNVALKRIQEICRDVAGVPDVAQPDATGEDVPLGAFADSMAALMPSFSGIGARRSPVPAGQERRRERATGRSGGNDRDGWIEVPGPSNDTSDGDVGRTTNAAVRVQPLPELRIDDELGAVLAAGFELRLGGSQVRLRAVVEVMTGDGQQIETDPPVGWSDPEAKCWIDPTGRRLTDREPVVDVSEDGLWFVLLPLMPEAMVRVDIRPELVP